MAALVQQIQNLVTKSSPFDGTSYAIDNTVFHTVPAWEISFEIRALSPGSANNPCIARFAVEDSVDGATWVPAATFEVVGLTGQTYPQYFSVNNRVAPGLRLGVANAGLRVSLVLLQGLIPSVTYQTTWTGPLAN